MAKRRMNKTIRKRIIKKAVLKAFSDRVNALRARQGELAIQVWEGQIGHQIAKKLKKASADTGFELHTSTNHLIILADDTAEGVSDNLSLRTAWNRLPIDLKNEIGGTDVAKLNTSYIYTDKGLTLPITHSRTFRIDRDSPIAKKLIALRSEAEALADEISEMNSSLWSIVMSANTVEDLIKIWPESKDFVPSDERPASKIVPVEEIQKVNAKLGLAA